MVLQATTDTGEIVKVIANDQGDLTTQSFLEQQTTGQVKLGTTEAGVVQGGEGAGMIAADPNDRLGWLFTKDIAGTGKFNYWFYGEGNQALTLDDLTNLNAIITVDTYTNGQSLPFFNIYTKSQGAGDAGPPAFPYHSKLTYGLSAEQHIVLGESIQAWSIVKPINHPGKRFVEFNTKTVEGTGLGTEEIWYITIHTDSTAPLATQILVQEIGYSALGSGISTIEPINVRLGLIT
tara:strand:+ start:208 stop:912 length:705 start_codon:yes stop_codon:yes gene_type:complete